MLPELKLPELKLALLKIKRLQTRDGAAVRIYAIDGVGIKPVHGAYKTSTGWQLCSWTLKGEYCTVLGSPRDLILPPHTLKGTVTLKVRSGGLAPCLVGPVQAEVDTTIVIDLSSIVQGEGTEGLLPRTYKLVPVDTDAIV